MKLKDEFDNIDKEYCMWDIITNHSSTGEIE